MSKLVEFAKSELERAKLFSEEGDFYGGMMGEAVMKLMKVFCEEGHSGMSASVCISLFEKLARWEPITPLTGEDSEWCDVGNELLQNNRCPRIFKEKDTGKAYDIDGKVFVDKDGCSYTNKDSRVYITFPYTPVTEYVHVDK